MTTIPKHRRYDARDTHLPEWEEVFQGIPEEVVEPDDIIGG